MKSLHLSKGLVTFVDDEDYGALSKYKWCADSKGYPVRSEKRSETGRTYRKMILMHRVILDAKPDQWVDHKDGNPLNNQKSNLRYADRTKNQRNRKTPISNKSGYKGVWFDKRRKRFVASIKTGGRTYTKRFETAIEAAEHYNKRAVELFGDFARLNDV